MFLLQPELVNQHLHLRIPKPKNLPEPLLLHLYLHRLRNGAGYGHRKYGLIIPVFMFQRGDDG